MAIEMRKTNKGILALVFGLGLERQVVGLLERNRNYRNRFLDGDDNAFPRLVTAEKKKEDMNSIILKGVTIGRGAVVAAGSVVTHDVPPLTVVAGNPAKVVKEIEISDAPREVNEKDMKRRALH